MTTVLSPPDPEPAMTTDAPDSTPSAESIPPTDPSPPVPPTDTAHAARLTPPEASGAASNGDAWGDPPRATSVGGASTTVRNRVLAGVGAVAIAGAAIFGVNLASHSSATASGPGGFAGGPGGAGFAGGPGRGTRGTIASIDGSTLTVKTATGTAKVTTSSATAVSASSAGSLSSVSAGDHLLVIGSTSGSTVTATSIIDRGSAATSTANAGAPGGGGGGAPSGAPTGTGGAGFLGGSGGGPPVSGTVTQVNAGHITMTGTDGTTYTVVATSATPITIEKPATLAGLATGEQVSVMGQTTGTTIAADRIIEGTTVGRVSR